MYCNLIPRLTMRLMGLGFSLHEAERITRLVMISLVIVFTIMGFPLCSCNGNAREGSMRNGPFKHPASTPRQWDCSIVGMKKSPGAGRRHRAFLTA
ncbi:MAG: hypothetical protein GX651_03870 [Methanomicrobiales archaeon]|nr:hypothetical protein [Methanomicrobiales archaeon]